MRCVVTGAAGFIGSHLCERLLADGHEVAGLDAFVPYYPRAVKEANLAPARAHPRFRFHELDLRRDDLAAAVAGADVVYHLAAMAGLARSWTQFDLYESCNVTGTHRVLEAARATGTLKRFVYASTSSVYGRYSSGDETLPTRPISPYGVTKLAGENLCRAFADECGLPLVTLRFFSVYGPRQRPDMGYHKFVAALLAGDPVTVFGDGQQMRGNTYVDDCVAAAAAAAAAPVGEVYNLGGGEVVSVWDVLRKLERITGRRAVVKAAPPRPGDQRHTCADTGKLARHLGWAPRVGLDDGLARQVEWQREAGEVPAARAA
ncbi:MAG: nucleotide sugar epimerase [Isosphaera sp.]|nr:nucleotide sugar epimerase [Isosphaera sp.]